MEQIKRRGVSHSAKNFDDLPNTALVGIQVVKAMTGKSRATIYRWIDRGILPRPVNTIGVQNTWTVDSIRAALNIPNK